MIRSSVRMREWEKSAFIVRVRPRRSFAGDPALDLVPILRADLGDYADRLPAGPDFKWTRSCDEFKR
ncbi:hypothetical protein [Sutterella massiliensis]|uniref:hypothetical protein n=1 Tax=Sutterella massiliensis TaxID=1816689 RepID=UPI00196189EB|nr:hypothetical protein [Sutterella massiliensis]